MYNSILAPSYKLYMCVKDKIILPADTDTVADLEEVWMRIYPYNLVRPKHIRQQW